MKKNEKLLVIILSMSIFILNLFGNSATIYAASEIEEIPQQEVDSEMGKDDNLPDIADEKSNEDSFDEKNDVIEEANHTEERVLDGSTDSESQDPIEEKRENSWRYEDGNPISNVETYSISDNAWKKVNGVYINSVGEAIPGAVKKGIDVSYYQGKINWEAVKSDGIDYAIIRCGYGDNYSSQDDKSWAYNVSECERLGIPYGVYIYSYATNTEMAKSEADHVLRLIRGHNLSYPVYFDMEDNSTAGISSSLKGDIAKTFCDTITSAGYKVGIYANLHWWTKYLTSPVFSNPSWSKWVAQYNATCDYDEVYDMWQCTSSGRVNGISGNVDLNFWIDYSLPYDDVSKGSWYYDAAYYMYRQGYMTGLSPTKFGPSAQISRAQFTTILYRMSGSPQIAYSSVFPDVPNGQFYTNAVLWANKVGVVTGYGNGKFGPSDLITREQMATILYRYARYCGYNISAQGDLIKFDDNGKVAPFASEAMRWAVGAGVISGNANGTLAPRNPADRASAAVMLMRFQNTYK